MKYRLATAALLAAILSAPAFAQSSAPADSSGAPAYSPTSAAVRQPAATLQATAQPTVPLQSSVPIFNPAYPPAASGGYGGWGWGGLGPGTNPYYGYLEGAADVTIANAQYQLTIQQARIVREQANREALLTRRATIEQQNWEREDWLKRYDPDAVRRRDQERDLRRSQNDPPASEIWSGAALNDLVRDIQKAESAGVRASAVPLDPDMLARLNLTSGTTYAGAGMLKDLTRFNWPMGLRKGAYQEARKKIEDLARMAVEQLMGGNLDGDVVSKLDDAVNDLTSSIKDAPPDMTPTQYIQATRYLRELKESLKVLQDPNAANYFGKWKAKGSSVGELVANMSAQGLTFGPATSGDEASYTALHRALVTYDYRLRQMGSR
jgi:hypothetical protein